MIFKKTIKKFIIFRPHKTIKNTPVHKYREINVKTYDDETINGWVVFPKKSNGKCILFSHGNTGNIGHRSHIADIFAKHGYIFIMYDYRGYGKSTGRPCEHGLFLDAEAIWSYLTNTLAINPKNIIIFGNSLGTSVSSHLISKLNEHNINYNCTILQSPFYSLKHLTSDIMPKMMKVLSVFIKEFNTYQYLENNKRPILLIHSKEDELISHKHSRQLFNKLCNKPCFTDIFYIKGGHNNPILDSNYINKINTFVYMSNKT